MPVQCTKDQQMAESIDDAELGRSKQSTSPREHLRHLLSIGWDPQSPLVQKYVRDHGLRKDLEEFAAGLSGKRHA